MFSKRNVSVVALALAIAAPLTAQSGTGVIADQARRAAAAAQRRAEIEAARGRAGVERTRTDQARIEAGRSGSTSSRIPPGHLPPRGSCRVWIDGVPPGQQPPVTSCAQAEQDRLTYGANARVIYGDSQSFPGKGKGKFKHTGTQTSASCVSRDAVVLGDGRVANVCRDANGNVVNQRGRVVGKDDDDDDDERFEQGNRGRSTQAKAAKAERKAGKKGGKGRG
jgi:hypothetical protein